MELSAKQIENWRKVLPAYGMNPATLSDDDVRKFAAKMQASIDKIAEEEQQNECED